MTEIGPQTESGAAVVPTTSERREWLLSLHRTNGDWPLAAAKAWALEVAEARDRATKAEAELAEARDRIAQIEEALAAAGREAADVVAASPFLVTREADGRWLADCGRVPGAMAYGATAAEARAAAATIVVCQCELLQEERQAEQQRHAVEMGEERELSAVLARAYVRERQRWGRGGGA